MTRSSIREFFALPPPLCALARTTLSALGTLIAIGFCIAVWVPGSVDGLLRVFTDAAVEIGMYQVTGFPLMATILANNLLSLLLVIAVGLLPILHLPALSLGVNALLLGGLAAFYHTTGRGLAAYFAGTLPHGVVELTALVLSCAAGLYVCRASTYRLLGRIDHKTLARTLSEALRVYTHWIVPLLVVSAALEAFVTPLIFSLFL